MVSPSTPALQTLPDLLSHDLDVPAGETLSFDIDGRVVTLHGADSGVIVLSAHGNAVVVRPQPDGRFVVTGALAHHHRSEPLAREDAITLAVSRLER